MPFQVNPPSSQDVASGPRRVALVIGNAKYTHEPELKNPVNDANAMAQVLERLGFRVITGANLDRDAMLRHLDQLQDHLEARPEAALLFYAGHGQQSGDKNYLIPTDAQISRPNHLEARAVPLDFYLQLMTNRASMSLVFLDACRNNNISRSLGMLTRSGAPPVGLRGPTTEIDDEDDTETFIAFATAPGKTADDGRDCPNSPFTSALLRHITTPGLSISDVMYQVSKDVRAATDNQQRPWSTLTAGFRFFFIPPSQNPQTGAPIALSEDRWIKLGAGREEYFKDLAGGPQMVLVPGGPLKKLDFEATIPKPFAVSRYPVTREQFEAFRQERKALERSSGLGQPAPWTLRQPRLQAVPEQPGEPPTIVYRASFPFQHAPSALQERSEESAVNVSWHDAKAYADWLSFKTQQEYRLLTATEWEYACRAGTASLYWQDRSNDWGLFGLDGTMWEWVEDVSSDNPDHRVLRRCSPLKSNDLVTAFFDPSRRSQEPLIGGKDICFRVARVI